MHWVVNWSTPHLWYLPDEPSKLRPGWNVWKYCVNGYIQSEKMDGTYPYLHFMHDHWHYNVQLRCKKFARWPRKMILNAAVTTHHKGTILLHLRHRMGKITHEVLDSGVEIDTHGGQRLDWINISIGHLGIQRTWCSSSQTESEQVQFKPYISRSCWYARIPSSNSTSVGSREEWRANCTTESYVFKHESPLEVNKAVRPRRCCTIRTWGLRTGNRGTIIRACVSSELLDELSIKSWTALTQPITKTVASISCRKFIPSYTDPGAIIPWNEMEHKHFWLTWGAPTFLLASFRLGRVCDSTSPPILVLDKLTYSLKCPRSITHASTRQW